MKRAEPGILEAKGPSTWNWVDQHPLSLAEPPAPFLTRNSQAAPAPPRPGGRLAAHWLH